MIVDDDRNLAFIVRAHLVNAGFSADVIHDGDEALDAICNAQPDVVLLDVLLPGVDGFEIIRRMRAHDKTASIPVIMLTARGGADDIVLGLEAGAQDYIVKPFNVAELTARVRAMYKLSRAQKEIDQLNHRLTTEVAYKTLRLEQLHNFVRELNRARDFEQICKLTVEMVRASTGCRRVSIMCPDPETGELVCRYALGAGTQSGDRTRACAAPEAASKAYTTGEMESTGSLAAVGSGIGGACGARKRCYDAEHYVSTPLVSAELTDGTERLGVLNAAEKEDGTPLTPDEIDCIASIADSAALAMHNEQRRSSLEKSIRALLATIGRLSEYRDEETGLHLERVQEYVQTLALRMSKTDGFAEVVNEQFIENIILASPLHDLGKVGIPDDILNKPGKLTDEEFQIIKSHTTIGRHTLAMAMEETGQAPLLQMCMEIAHSHHERWDGKGYPCGLKGSEIPLAARIVTVVDAYDAITSRRCYKEALSHAHAVATIKCDAGNHFDPDVVEVFLEVADEFDRIRADRADPAPIFMLSEIAG